MFGKLVGGDRGVDDCRSLDRQGVADRFLQLVGPPLLNDPMMRCDPLWRTQLVDHSVLRPVSMTNNRIPPIASIHRRLPARLATSPSVARREAGATAGARECSEIRIGKLDGLHVGRHSDRLSLQPDQAKRRVVVEDNLDRQLVLETRSSTPTKTSATVWAIYSSDMQMSAIAFFSANPYAFTINSCHLHWKETELAQASTWCPRRGHLCRSAAGRRACCRSA
jgi:hypothetical protein